MVGLITKFFDGLEYMAMSICVQSYCLSPVSIFTCVPPLKSDLKKQNDAFGNRCLHTVTVYYWSGLLSNQQLLCEIESRSFTCVVREHHLWMYENVAYFLEVDGLYL